jgi:hypothetical protein
VLVLFGIADIVADGVDERLGTSPGSRCGARC